MNLRLLDYLYIATTIALTVYGQLILKWRISAFGALPAPPLDKLRFLLLLPFDPIIFSGFAAAFFASLAWMAAMTKFELSQAYPFMSLNFVVVILLSGLILGETVSFQKWAGIALIVAGTIVAARG